MCTAQSDARPGPPARPTSLLSAPAAWRSTLGPPARLGSIPVDERSDTDLLAQIRAGQRWAWDELVARHQRRLWTIARSRGLDHDGAHDAIQATWLCLLDHVDTIRDPAALKGWLNTVMKREAQRIGRQHQRERERAERLARQPQRAGESPEGPVLFNAELAMVGDAFARLSERCRALLRLLFSQADLSYAEIATELDMPIGSLGPSRARCLDRLRNLLPPDPAPPATGRGSTGGRPDGR